MRRHHLVLPAAAAFVLAFSVACPPEAGGDPTCASYCATITEKCTGGSVQYESEQACVDFCNASTLNWGVGTTADTAGNTLGCREYHAGAANNDDHCLHAGPTGGAVCGGYCDVYCDAAQGNCVDGNALYADSAGCHSTCEHFPDNGSVNEASGNSVQCRLFHLGAAKSDPAGHCSHGSAAGDNVCGDWCQVYCDTILDACDGSYSGPAACLTACEDFATDGNIGDATGDTVQCRIFHAGVANNDSHCDHAGAASTSDTCGGGGGDTTPTCANYCSTITANCGGGSAQYDSENACLDFCNANNLAWGTGTTEDADGNTLGCRIFHAGAANNDDHCTHAGPTGGAACGSYCDVYCDAMGDNCAGSYADDAACQTACGGFATDGAVNAATGDNVQCRIFHVGAAAADDTHCDHADEDSAAGTCVN